MASAALLRLHPPLFSSPRRPRPALVDPHRPKPYPSLRRSRPISASRSPPSSESEEEQRWLREEQRWLREEQRWIREESRWKSERESLLREIASLREELERRRSSVDGRTDGVDVLLRALKERVAPPPVLVEEAGVKEMVLESSLEEEVVEEEGEEERKELTEGSEGEDVRLMQAGSNGAPSVLDVSEVQQISIKDTVKEDEVALHRVFLLGENRWEEPSRLVNKEKPMSTKMDISLVKCLTCRGEGRLMCTECDGTGEPNVEPQFLEWVGEGMKCPYCEGLGYTICDVCEGKTLVEKQQS